MYKGNDKVEANVQEISFDQIKIIDFGLSKHTSGDETKKLKTKTKWKTKATKKTKN